MKSNILALIVVTALISCSLPVLSQDIHQIEGYQGVSWKEVVPLKRASFVGFDEDSYLDDYSYLASIPVNVFYDTGSDTIFSNPLLFYEPASSDPVLNSNTGIINFMDDWMTFCDGKLDQIQLINVHDGNLKEKWDTLSHIEITTDDPYSTASELALANWETSNTAVVACIEDDFTDANIHHEASVQGNIPGGYTLNTFEIKNSRDVGIIPQHNNFTIQSQYKYVTANLTWRGGKALDPDLQLVDWEMGMVDASSHWSFTDLFDYCRSYVTHPGEWSASVTYMPTKKSTWITTEEMKSMGPIREKMVSLLSKLGQVLPLQGTILNAMAQPKGVNYMIEVTMYPGTEIQLPTTPYGCRNAIFDLQSNANLGILLRDESGATFPLVEGNHATYSELGRGNYSIIVLKMDDSTSDIDFTLRYAWDQKFYEQEGDALHSAAEGAILASLTNAPLLYVSSTKVSSETKDALDTLSIDEIYFINLGDYSEDSIRETLKEYGTVYEYTQYDDVYSKIQSITHQNDIIFSTVNPWSYWKVGELQPAGEKRQAFYIGPGALAAAHHGSPLLITDVHPSLSCANAWHNNEWVNMAPTRYYPPVISMTLTGKSVYDFLDDIGLNGVGEESMLTVAGQFDIGTTWDRVFPGAANPGRIMGTPTDTAYWVCRSVFYPALIFANPAVDSHGVHRITGSQSERKATGLQIITPESDIQVMYPILESHICYEHRFNELTYQRWGVQYEAASGIVPFYEPSPNKIDEGSNIPYKEGIYYPDMTSSEITSFYTQKLGYDSVYTTNFPSTIENLNRGVLYWIEVMHGLQTDSGSISFWKDQKYETNPWRGYEQGGSTENPDTLTFMKNAGFDILPSTVAGNDGIVIAYVGQLQTEQVYGDQLMEALDNVHSACFMGGSCLIANTLLHLSLIRSGFVYQIVDPWVTSWYGSFGFLMYLREVAQGATAGEAYGEMIRHVGIEYMNDDYWWDTSENIEYFGDPDLVAYSPYGGWEKPTAYTTTETINGHSLSEAIKHPSQTPGFEAIFVVLILGLLVAIRKRKS